MNVTPVRLVSRSFGPFTVARVTARVPGMPAHVTYSLLVQLTSNVSVQVMLARFHPSPEA
jgi:hypothetical protein